MHSSKSVQHARTEEYRMALHISLVDMEYSVHCHCTGLRDKRERHVHSIFVAPCRAIGCSELYVVPIWCKIHLLHYAWVDVSMLSATLVAGVDATFRNLGHPIVEKHIGRRVEGWVVIFFVMSSAT